MNHHSWSNTVNPRYQHPSLGETRRWFYGVALLRDEIECQWDSEGITFEIIILPLFYTLKSISYSLFEFPLEIFLFPRIACSMYVTAKLQFGFMALLIIKRLAGIMLLSNVYEMSSVLFITISLCTRRMLSN